MSDVRRLGDRLISVDGELYVKPDHDGDEATERLLLRLGTEHAEMLALLRHVADFGGDNMDYRRRVWRLLDRIEGKVKP